MMAILSGLGSEGTVSFKKEKRQKFLCCVHLLHKANFASMITQRHTSPLYGQKVRSEL